MMTDDAGLRGSIDQLNGTISDLRVTVGELGTEVRNLAERGHEDRDKARTIDSRVSRLEAWRNKVTGGLVLIGTATLATGSVLVAWILK